MGYAQLIGVLLVAASMAGNAWQFRAAGKRAAELDQVRDEVAALVKLREGDKAKIAAFARRQAEQARQRANLQREIERMKNDDSNVADFMRLPVPDGLRQRAEQYINRRATDGN